MPSTSSPDLLAGRYRLESVLGRGGMGEVRAGTDLRLDRSIAVKLLRTDLSGQPELRERFDREARAAARISHPNVVAVFDTGEHHGVPYIVMERLPGSTLADELATGTLTETQACTVVMEILAALDAAHRLGILHRDIKPGNILRGHDGRAKVADFGIAKIAEDSEPGTTGILFGTAAYLAPERLSGELATAASDLYSVGVVLYEALAGRPPFRADTPLGLVSSIADGHPSPLAALRPDVTPAVIAVAEQAMAKEPERRFDCAPAMSAALAAAMGAPSAAEAVPTVPIATIRSARRGRDQPPVAATDVLHTHRQADARTGQENRRRPAVLWLAGALSSVLVIAVLLVVLTSGGDTPAPSEPAPSSPSSGTTIPAPLRRAIDQLDQAVQP